MSKKFNNNILLIILLGLAGILVLTKYFHKTDKNLKTDIVSFNVDDVSKIQLHTKSSDKDIVVTRKNDDDWTVSDGKNTFKAGKDIVTSYLDELQKIKSQRLAAKSKDKWADFQLTDSAATRIKLFDTKNKSLLDILIGKFSYKQAQNPYGRNNIQGISYVRLAKEKEIYAVDGFLPMSLNRSFDDWRDKSLSKFNVKDVKKISFVYPDSSFTLAMKDSAWYCGDMPVDMKKVENYLTSMQNKKGNKFKNDFQATTNPLYRLKIEGDNLTDIEIKCFKTNEDGKFAIQSSKNTEAIFESDHSGIVKQIYKSLKDFAVDSKMKK